MPIVLSSYSFVYSLLISSPLLASYLYLTSSSSFVFSTSPLLSFDMRSLLIAALSSLFNLPSLEREDRRLLLLDYNLLSTLLGHFHRLSLGDREVLLGLVSAALEGGTTRLDLDWPD